MALRHIDSWDHYATANRAAKGWTFTYAGASPGDEGCTIGAYGRNSTNGLRGRNGAVSGKSSRATLGVSNTSGATAIMGFAFRIDAGVPAADFCVCQVFRGSTELISVTCSATGTLSVRRGDREATILSTSVSTITHSTFYFIELKVTLHDSTGVYDLKVNGTTYTSGSGVDTLVSGAATWDGIGLGGTNIGQNYSIDFDDLYVADGSGGVEDDFLGDHRIVCVVASSGNGGNTDWSPSTGSDHGALVDENPPNESDYNQSGTAGQRDTYNFAAVGVSGTVKALQTLRYIKAEAAGVRSVAPVIRISSTNYDGTTQALGSDWTYHREIYRQNPATTAAWTISGIDGAEFGAKVTA
jgi:hypothetical protein